MTQAADLVLRNGRVRTLAGETAAAIAVRDGRIVRVGRDSEVGFLDGVETTAIDLGNRVVLPGFIDAHTHMDMLGRQRVEADLSGAASPAECLDRLATRREETDGPVLGYGYDESRWDGDPLTREQLDEVSTDRPVVAYREDIHLASVNGVVLDRYGGALPAEYVETHSGEPTGVLREEALSVLDEQFDTPPERIREYLLTAQAYAHRHGVTAVHDIIRDPVVARQYRELDRDGSLALRVRLNYVAEHFDAVEAAGLAPDHGTDRLTLGAVKEFADGSFGSHTARLSDPYADGEGRGEFSTDPEDLAALVERVSEAGFQAMVHAIGDEATETVVETLAGGERHRVEHAEMLSAESIETIAEEGIVVSAQPNFLKWARDGGLYDDRLGSERRRRTNQFRRVLDGGAELAFGSDCMPMDPLFGIEQAVTAPEESQRLDVTEAVRAYSRGGAYAGFDENRLGRLEPGYCADLVVLDGSPWEADRIDDLTVELTVAEGTVVFERHRNN